ncbi:MAG: hypothetical protein IIA40_06470 [SAR324 cluster bacterium]|nr:hypothetical protein [SAR324 cluster bacterium]
MKTVTADAAGSLCIYALGHVQLLQQFDQPVVDDQGLERGAVGAGESSCAERLDAANCAGGLGGRPHPRRRRKDLRRPSAPESGA